MNFIKLIKAALNFKTKLHNPTDSFALYCKNNPSANACKLYDL